MVFAEKLRELIRVEQNEQETRWNNQSGDWKSLRKEGVAVFPIQINKRRFGFADYPVLEVSFHQKSIHNNLKNGSSIAIFSELGEAVSGILYAINEHHAELLLHAPDFPDFLDDGRVGFRLAPDTKTFDQMHGVLKRIIHQENKHLNHLVNQFYTSNPISQQQIKEGVLWKNNKLNASQKRAVETILGENPITIVHGPPGTGKTTTLVEAIQQLILNGKKVIASAPSNAAVDHLATQLLHSGVHVLRLGSSIKTSPEILPYTQEGILAEPENYKTLKKLRQRADELRKMAGQYKRKFGKEEREQRNLLLREVKSIRQEIRQMSELFISRRITHETVILGTPVGLRDAIVHDFQPDYFVLDEAGQCLEPLGWLGAELASQLVLAGDPFQLPPTVISDEANRNGLGVSMLEKAFHQKLPNCLLNIQYRMPQVLIDFSSSWFYEHALQSFIPESSIAEPLLFIDAAGSELTERKDEDGGISNPGEIDILEKYIETEGLGQDVAFISPYAAQVQLAKQRFPTIRCSTIDSFQGQEEAIILLSLVRNNPEFNIGFLSDYRRMNVALTRAKTKLVVIGDSVTLSSDKFFQSFLEYVEKNGSYRSVFEYLY